jgi:glycerol uptake facilitator-like aquaporin
VGAALLLAGIVGSGIMAERLAGGNAALALLANSIATGGVLVAIILAFGPISGAHFNPAITLAQAFTGRQRWSDAGSYVVAQLVGAVTGVALANLMFGKPAFFASHHGRHGFPLLLGEFVATFGLLLVIGVCVRYRASYTAYAVGSYIVGAYWFSSSTSFANPAVAIARSMSDTFAGIAPVDVAPFIAAEVLGAIGATVLLTWLVPEKGYLRMKRRVLFVCIHNSARSQMAQALLNVRCPDVFEAESAGLEPGTLNPLAVEAMREIGIDISHNKPKSVESLLDSGAVFSHVVTVCDEANADRCPVFPGAGERLNWNFPDPAALEGSWAQRLAQTRTIRDMIRARIEAWCAQACG